MLEKYKDFYSALIANFLSGGELINRTKLSSVDIKPLYDRIVTKKSIKKVICIYKIPVDYNSSLIEILNDIVFKTEPSCEMFTNSYSIPLEGAININSDDFKRRMASSEKRYMDYLSLFDGMTNTEMATGKKLSFGVGRRLFVNKATLNKYKEDFESYEYTHQVLSNGGKFSSTFLFVELLAPDNKKMNQIRREICEYLITNNFKFKELRSNSSNYMSNYCPASFMHEFSNKEFMDVLLSEENLSYLTPYRTHGFIGDGTGILFGMNMGSKTPFILNFFGSGDRQINFISAPSGWGKTLIAFMSALSAIGQNLHVSALDIKGDEWEKLFAFVRGMKIDISESSKTYVNTLRLDDIEVTTKQEAKEFFDMAEKATINIIRSIVGPNSEEIRDCDAIARNIVRKTFSTKEVDYNKPKSLKNTAQLKYEDLIPNLKSLENSQSYVQSRDLIAKMRRSLTDKFIVSDIFKGREITLRDIIDSPLVIYSMNKNKDQEQSTDDLIRTNMISYLDTKKISIRKKLKLGTIVYYEELQRKDEFKSLITYINGVVTGARSSNVSVFLLCNSPDILNDKDLRPIASNLSTCFVGKVENEDDYEVYKKIGCKDLIPKIQMISDKENPLKNYFAVSYNTGVDVGQAVVKCILPEDVEKALATRDKIVTETKKKRIKSKTA